MGRKRCKNLYEQVANWNNLTLAAKKARKGKRYRPDVLQVHFDLESILFDIQRGLRTQRFEFSGYRSFLIRDPKERLISAAPYRDRIVHHAICNVIEPLFERRFIYDSYACRSGKGQSRAIRRASGYAREFAYVGKTDLARYFHSIDHDVLSQQIRRVIGDRTLLHLVDQLIALPFPGQQIPCYFPDDDLFAIIHRRCGLPIGNQTSQLFGNVFLDPLDHFVKERLRIGGYVRYMDDIVLFANSKSELHDAMHAIGEFLKAMRQRLSERKTWLTTTKHGFPFLGFTVSSSGIRPLRRNVIRFRRRMMELQQQYDDGARDIESVRQSIQSYWGFFAIANQPRRFRKILADFPMFADLQRHAAKAK